MVTYRTRTSVIPAFALTAACFLASPSGVFANENKLSESEQAQGWKLLFNGANLDGWKNARDMWSVKNGSITATSSSENREWQDKASLIWTGGVVKDFELKYSAKVRRKEGGKFSYCHCIFRGQLENPQSNEVIGMNQVFTHSERSGHIGIGTVQNWGEKIIITNGVNGRTRTIESVGVIPGAADAEAAFKRDGWNEYGIRAVGNHIALFANGQQVLDVIDKRPETRRSGIIAFGFYHSSDADLEIRHVRLKHIDSTPPETVTQNHPAPQPVPQKPQPVIPAAPVPPPTIAKATAKPTPTPTPNPTLKSLHAQSDPIVGRWRLRRTILEVSATGSFINTAPSYREEGRWRKISGDKYEFDWSDGRAKEEFNLRGNQLKKYRNGWVVLGERIR